MDESLVPRIDKLLARLKARTHSDGTPKANYAESVANIRAELSAIERRYPKQEENTNGE